MPLASLLALPLLASPTVSHGPLGDASLKIGGLLASMVDVRFAPGDTQPGFSVADARLSLLGTGVRDFEFFVQGNLMLQPAVLDLRVTWAPDPRLAIDTGLLKVPFSAEFILDASVLDFTDRAQAVNTLAPGRQVGVQARGQAAGRRVQYALGVFNGDAGIAGNADAGFLVAGRLATEWSGAWGRVEAGVSSATSADAAFASPIAGAFTGRRWLLGADTRVELGDWYAAAEAIWARFDAANGAGGAPFGYQISGGYTVSPIWAARMRYDHLDPDRYGPVSDVLVFGVGPGEAVFSLWLDYVLPLTDAAGAHRLLLTAQAFW